MSFAQDIINEKPSEPNDRDLVGKDYMALFGLAREVVESKIASIAAENSSESKAFYGEKHDVIIRRLMAPFELAIIGLTTDSLKAPDNTLDFSNAAFVKNFALLKRRLEVISDGAATGVAKNAQYENWGRKFSLEEETKLHEIYSNMAEDMLAEVTTYQQRTAPQRGRNQDT